MKKELENLNESDEKVRLMLASLKQIEAPKDFEFRLKARIANANPKNYQTGGSFKRRLAFALPAFASIAVSSFVVLNGNFFGGAEQVSSISDTQAQPANIAQPLNPATAFVAANTVTDNREPEKIFVAEANNQIEKNLKSEASFTVVKSTHKTKAVPRDADLRREEETLSKVATQKEAPVFNARGIQPDKKVETPKDFNGGAQNLSAQDIFLTFGIETVSENGNLKVKSVKQNSAAERLGVKADDVIETLNGQKISAEPFGGRKVELKKLGVKRGESQLEIPLQ